MSRSSVLASLASQDVSASEFDKLDGDNGSDYQSQIDLKSPLASPTFTGSITTPEIRSGSTLTIDPATVGDNTGLVLLKGNLQVDGTSTTINSTTLTVDDLNLTLASGAADSAAANGAGITIDGASATMTYTHSTTSFDFNKPVNVTGAVTADGLTVDGSSMLLNNTVGAASFKGSAAGLGLTIDSQGTASDIIFRTTGSFTKRALIEGSTGDISFYEDTGTTAKFFWDASEERLGIGTSSPAHALDIKSGDIRIEDSSANKPALFFTNTDDTRGCSVSGSLNTLILNAGDTDVATGGNSSLSFQTDSTERMRIDSSGNVGIGTTSQTNRLAVKSTSSSLVAGKVYHGTTFQIEDASHNAAQVVAYSEIDKAVQFAVERSKSSGSYNDMWVMGMGENSKDWRLSKDTLGTVLTVDTSGNVGIGSASTGQKLEIINATGAARAVFDRSATNREAGFYIKTNGSENWQLGSGVSSTNTNFEIYDYASSEVDVYLTSGTTDGWTTVSDARIKENIQDIENRLDDLKKIKVRSFTLKKSGVQKIGFIAQELLEACPEAVDIGSDDVHEKDGETFKKGDPIKKWGVNKTNIIPLIVKAVQELSAKVTALENAS